MLKIVVDARSVVAKRSGIGNYTEALIQHMVPLAEDMQFTVLRHPSVTEPLLDHPRVEELHFAGETKSVDTVFRLGRRHDFADHDLYHSPADLIPLGLRCPWVVTIHDLMWLEAPQLASAFLPVRLANSLWYRLNFARSIPGARKVIAISQATATAIARHYPGEASKISVVHHGLDHARYAAGSGGPRSLLDEHLPSGCRFSLIVGQGSPYKNHDGMLRAFVEAMHGRDDHKLVLVRRFSRVDRAMNELLARPEVQAKVVVLPFVSDQLLLTLYRHATMLLFVSHYEGFGLPALEAMSLGTPVLASTAEAVREITQEGALAARPDDHADMVQKIRQLDSDAQLRQRLVAAGRERAAEFCWDRCARATIDVYRQALGR